MRSRPIQTSAIDRGQRKFAERKRREAEDAYIAAFQTALSTYHGRLLLWEFLRRFGALEHVWVAGMNQLDLAYRAGRQSCGLAILDGARLVDTEGWGLLQAEARERELALQRELAASAKTAEDDETEPVVE